VEGKDNPMEVQGVTVSAIEHDSPGDLDGDLGNEPEDGSYPPDGADLLRRTVPGASTMSTKMLAFERSRRAIELRKAGLKYEDIARELGYANAKGASRAVQRAMDKTLNEGARELRTLQYNRLNELLSRWYPRALGGRRAALDEFGKPVIDPTTGQPLMIDHPPDLNASKEVRAIIAQLDELMGTGVGKTVTMKGNVQHDVSGEVTHTQEQGVIVVDFDGDAWQAALRRATQAGITEGMGDGSETSKFEQKPPTGYIAPALTALPAWDERDEGEIIEAEVVEPGSKHDPRAAFKLDDPLTKK
jgi:hypothetical protein